MRVLIYSRAFLPRIGGLEIHVDRLARYLVAQGHEVRAATVTPTSGEDQSLYAVLRNPSPPALLRAVAWCDVYYQPNVSLRGFWPLLILRRPWVVSHHSWYTRSDGRITFPDRLKHYLVRWADGSIAVSAAIAADLDGRAQVVPHAYREHIFRRMEGVARDRQLIFVGRLVSDKGVDLLLEALALLAGRGVRPDLTIVGEGPEAPALRAQTNDLGLSSQVQFLGLRRDEELAKIYCHHRIAVVPSRYNEPFGIVALEAIACGCAVVGSEGGGLAEAIGRCGLTFPNGDVAALAERIERLLRNPNEITSLGELAEEHLSTHRGPVVFARYHQVLRSAVGARHK